MNHYEIEACVIRAKNGNREELLKVLEQYKPFIIKTAKGFYLKDYDMYDLLQIGYIALINAVAKYRSGSNTFSTYAYTSIKNAFRYLTRQNSKYNTELSLNSPIDSDGANSHEYIDCIESEVNFEENLIEVEKIKELRRAVSKLSAEEMELVIMVYYSGAKLTTYAEKKSINYQQAIRKRNKILEKLSHCIKK